MILRQLKQRANKIDHLQNEFSKITQYATELQMYIGLQEIEKTTSEATHYIEYLESGDDFDEKNIKTGRQDQAQYLIPKSIEQIKPSMLRTLTIPEDKKMTNILACRIFPDGKYLVLDNQSYGSELLLFSNDGIFLRKIAAFRGPSYDACIVRNNTVAVTLLLATNQTQLVDAEENNIIRTFKLSHACYGVVSDGQMMFISSMEKSTMVNLINLSQTILEEVKAHHISLYKGNIYGTIYNENKVCCYKSTGEPLWTFMHHDIVKPQGLTLDKNGFVYIASYGNNSIVVISPENKRCKTILSEADGIMNPYEIDINSKTGMMIVASEIKKDSNTLKKSIFTDKFSKLNSP
ncbi:unnamed protein product [Mytilus coruscus]|uniref:TRIM2_3 n=1 Tax=Mytilus coruscus TaxID=42192 RepID=A0A6J8B240_MYTCO|nr:unnamed protein product [Mytilus coruscus]